MLLTGGVVLSADSDTQVQLPPLEGSHIQVLVHALALLADHLALDPVVLCNYIPEPLELQDIALLLVRDYLGFTISRTSDEITSQKTE